jgi:hypothetical protein
VEKKENNTNNNGNSIFKIGKYWNGINGHGKM